MCSTTLVFAAALGIKVFSIQPGLKPGHDLNILTRSGTYPAISNANELYHGLIRDIGADRIKKIPDWLKPDGGACRRISRLAVEMIERRK